MHIHRENPPKYIFFQKFPQFHKNLRYTLIADNSNDDTQPEAPEIRISMSDIIMNQVDGFTSADYARYNPETDDEVVWNKEDIVAYYGTDLTPAYVPNVLRLTKTLIWKSIRTFPNFLMPSRIGLIAQVYL